METVQTLETNYTLPPQNLMKRKKQKKISPFTSKRKKKALTLQAEEQNNKIQLIHTIKETEHHLALAFRSFNEARDKDLINASIYEIKALQSQHNFLIRQLKKKEKSSWKFSV